jgi:predicted RNase H-like HicB family nuclease
MNDMEAKRFIYWKEEDMWIGYLEEYPDYRTQGETLEDLKEHLRDLHEEFKNETIPHVRRAAANN